MDVKKLGRIPEGGGWRANGREKGPTCAAFLRRAIAYFHARGITRIERLITDNAWACRYSLREGCSTHGITQKFIKPHCPWQNGKVERFNRTLQTERANTGRRHSALGDKPPISRLQQRPDPVHLAAGDGPAYGERADHHGRPSRDAQRRVQLPASC